jgi:putative flippase GtrA
MSERAAAWPSILEAEVGRVFRFGLVGILNTAIGGCVIVLLQWGCRLDPFFANASGFAVGIGSGFVLNKGFVFGNRLQGGQTFGRYGVAFALAFGLNQLLLAALVRGQFAPSSLLFAQGTALASYSIASFVLCRFWVFRRCRE